MSDRLHICLTTIVTLALTACGGGGGGGGGVPPGDVVVPPPGDIGGVPGCSQIEFILNGQRCPDPGDPTSTDTSICLEWDGNNPECVVVHPTEQNPNGILIDPELRVESVLGCSVRVAWTPAQGFSSLPLRYRILWWDDPTISNTPSVDDFVDIHENEGLLNWEVVVPYPAVWQMRVEVMQQRDGGDWAYFSINNGGTVKLGLDHICT